MTLEADSIYFYRGHRTILGNIYLKLETGQVTGILGRNGCGKSTLFQIIFGTLRGDSQSVRVDGRYCQYPYQQSGLIRYLPQSHFLPKNLSVNQILDLYQLDKEYITDKCSIFNKYLEQPIHKLSGGEQRLFETMLILFSDVKFVMLDEPFAQLSPLWIEQVKEWIIAEKFRKSILISDHQYCHILELSDRLYLLTDTRLLNVENSVEVLQDYGYLKEQRISTQEFTTPPH